jgi:hypothetical protein
MSRQRVVLPPRLLRLSAAAECLGMGMGMGMGMDVSTLAEMGIASHNLPTCMVACDRLDLDAFADDLWGVDAGDL